MRINAKNLLAPLASSCGEISPYPICRPKSSGPPHRVASLAPPEFSLYSGRQRAKLQRLVTEVSRQHSKVTRRDPDSLVMSIGSFAGDVPLLLLDHLPTLATSSFPRPG
ncbi:hypothetical protein ACLB2K_041098 [Fragaria x ananassa]